MSKVRLRVVKSAAEPQVRKLAVYAVSRAEEGSAPRQTSNPASFTDMHLGLFASYTFVGKPYQWGWTEWADGTAVQSLDELADNLDVEDFAATAAAMRAQYVIFTTWLRCQTITEEWWARRAAVQWPPERAYRYTILQAAVSGRMGGGVTWSFGPRPGGKWEQGVPAFCERLGVLVDRAGASLFGTRPSRAYVIKGAQDWPDEGQPLNGLAYCATESRDGKKTFVHVFLPPKERHFQLPVPANGRLISQPSFWTPATRCRCCTTDAGVRLTLDPADRWDNVDTIIVME